MWDIWQNTLMHMHYVCEYGHMFFSERLYTFVHLYENNYWCVYMRDFYCIKWSNILLQNGHCGPVFYCVAYKCIWLSYKCIYIKVHLMRLMHLCRHYQAPCSSLSLIIIPPSLPLFLCAKHPPPFLPLERVSLSNSTDAHTWRDRMRHYLTQTDAHTWHRGFLRMSMRIRSWPPTHDDAHTHAPLYKSQLATFTPCTCDYHCSEWCKTPYIGIPVQELWLKQPPVYSQPPFRRLSEGRAGESGETKKA